MVQQVAKRVWLGLVAVVLAAVLGGCGYAGSTDPGCGECVEELAEVRAAIKELPDVKRLRTLVKYPASPTNGAGVRIEVTSTEVGDTGLQDVIAGVVWKSRLTPIDELKVSVLDSRGEFVDSLPYDFHVGDVSDRAAFEERYGPRPVP